ncbi:hypothetical protein H4Q26_013297 [Puccinia striiformis f. sp. tritici PST-130]|nr:hypothetical protein H4Q26_013297 [Puccinia striiformis f. sp. tritici PST-130]
MELTVAFNASKAFLVLQKMMVRVMAVSYLYALLDGIQRTPFFSPPSEAQLKSLYVTPSQSGFKAPKANAQTAASGRRRGRNFFLLVPPNSACSMTRKRQEPLGPPASSTIGSRPHRTLINHQRLPTEVNLACRLDLRGSHLRQGILSILLAYLPFHPILAESAVTSASKELAKLHPIFVVTFNANHIIPVIISISNIWASNYIHF